MESQPTPNSKAADLHIGNTSELLEQVSGNEREEGVLGGDNLVRSVSGTLEDLALWIEQLWWQLLVDIDITRSAGGRGT